MREQYRQQLHIVHDETVGILADISITARKAVAALVEGDVVAAQEIIDGDDEFDRRTLGVEESVLHLIATQFPVARDLRLLQSLVIIAMHEERMADYCANIAKCTKRTAGRKGPQTLYDLIQAQGNLLYRVLDATREALANRDLELAVKLPELDEPIDSLYKQFYREQSRLTDEEDLDWASNLVIAARSVERIADHSVDIGERLVYLITGERASLEEVAQELELEAAESE